VTAQLEILAVEIDLQHCCSGGTDQKRALESRAHAAGTRA